MEVTNLTLAYLVEELKPVLEGAFIKKVQEVSKNVFKFRLHTAKGTKDLIVLPNCLYLTDFQFTAPKMPHGYSLFLHKRLENQKVLGISQHFFDRIVFLELSDYVMVFEFFGEGNIILLNKENEILMPLHREKWKDRTLKKNIQYEFPPLKGSPLSLDIEKLEAEARKSDKPLFRFLLKHLNVAPIFLEEALALAKIKPEDKALQPGTKLKAIGQELSSLYTVEAKKASPNQVRHQKAIVLLPFPLTRYPPEQSFKSLSEALDGFYSKHILLEDSRELKEAAEAKVSKVQANLDRVLKAKEEFEATDKVSKEKADLIYQHYAEIEEVVKVMKKALDLKMDKKDIMYKMKLAGEKGLIPKDFVKDVDLKKKKLILNIK